LHKRNYHNDLLPGSFIKKVPTEQESVLLRNNIKPKKTFYFFKRGFDIFFSVLFIIGILSWLTPVIGLWILIDSKGPVFFIQLRVGKNGRLFRCLKFRTMVVNEEADEKQAQKNDLRITRAGRFLRQTNIDEFPQFINILLGDMSIIGPRPHMLTDCTRFSFVIPVYKFRTLVRPGITGLAQVKGQYGPTLDYESIFMRYHWDAEYIRNAGFWLDLKIVFLTFLRGLGNIISSAGSLFFKQQGEG
jgi:putative colanic acid biosynthesis UDP-glucose lipid carrier transferase